MDQFLIDLELNVSSDPIARTTYSGIHNVSQFDLSFGIDGQCSENYHGPQCDAFCMEVPGQFTCDSDGNIVCVNSNRSPESNCTQCRVPGRDPQNNCGDAIGNVFCTTGVPGQFTCDSDGNIVCVNSNRSPESNCTQCRVPGRDPQNNCGDAIGNVFCTTGVPGQFTCDSDGNIVCVNSNRSPESNCTQCREPGEDPENNCGDTSGNQWNTES